MAKNRKKRNGGCLTILLILAAIVGIGSLFRTNSTRNNVSSYSSVSIQKTPTPKTTAITKKTAVPVPTTTKRVTETPKGPSLSASNTNAYFSGIYDKNHRPFKGTYYYESNGAKVERIIDNGMLTNELSFVSNHTTVTGSLSNENVLEEVTILYSNGDKYIGHIVNGKKRGYGKYFWKNGDWYEGSWYDDTMSGKGRYYFSGEPSCYYLDGYFVNGDPYGTLTYVSEKRISYTTKWKNGKCISTERQ